MLIAMTGFGQVHDQTAAADAGFHYHVAKPASIDHLVDLITRSID
jgi:CheY-like chemotaxis protein